MVQGGISRCESSRNRKNAGGKVAAAAKLFAHRGFVRTSVSEIVSAVDVAKGLFYYYFTTKDDMVKAVVEGYCSYLGTLAGQIADGEGTAREKFAKLMHPEVWHECFTAR